MPSIAPSLSLPLFEETVPQVRGGARPKRVGGGMAALVGREIHAKPEVRYQSLDCRTVLNHCDTARMPDCWTINPYRGCEFGCTYCYARYTHEYLGLEGWEAFEKRIFVKAKAPEVFRRQAVPSRLRARPIAIGTATDPYQPAERRFRVTRGILETLAPIPGLRIGIITKSSLVMRDVDLLLQIQGHSDLSVFVSLTTVRTELARKIDPRAPTPGKRLQTVRALREAGLRAGIHAMPILPGINDGPEDLDALFAAARGADAAVVGIGLLFLPKASRSRFLPFVRREFPDLVPRYRAFYEGSLDPPKNYREDLHRLIERLSIRHGVAVKLGRSRREAAPDPQMSLSLG